MKAKKTCCICGAEYWSERLNSKYCSDECRKIGRKEYFKERYNNNAEKLKEQSREWREKHPEYIKAYADRYRKENPHYDRDRWRKIRGSEKRVFECIVCGKVFETWNPNKKTCSDECKQANVKAKERERKRARDPEKEHEKWIRQRYGSEEAHQQHLRDLEQKRQEQMEQARKCKEAEKEAKRILGKCIVCGNDFETFNPTQKTCCKECGKKLSYARKQHRIPKKQIIDKDITLEALFRRDSGVCYLCGGVCDWNDKQGNIVGALYPSIDHVTPVSKGGLHSWQNVRLAHFACNVAKSDAINPDFDGIVPGNAYQYARKVSERRKEVEQWTKTGELVAVYESTAEAERKTGIKCRGIQNCARGETKSYCNYVWKYA